MYTYRPKGVCSRAINIDLDGDVIKYVKFEGGCEGNAKSIAKLIEGKSVQEVSTVLSGVTCGSKGTSCGDQLAQALKFAQDSAN